MAAAVARPSRRFGAMRLLAAIVALAVFTGLMALGTWQIERRIWKLALIERVTRQLQAEPVDPPVGIDPRRDEYRRLRLTGTFLDDRETLVQASTELGGGFWVLTPLRLVDGRVVLVNRGFVPPERREPAARGERAAAPGAGTTVTFVGLLRPSEPGGGFLRRNDPSAGRWHSRDVVAIARARGLGDVLPYFVDAEATAAERAQPQLMADADRIWPAAGLTVIRFNNHHLVYALTWYGLALMVALAAAYLGREWWREGRPAQRAGRDAPASRPDRP
ncbi:SURF1 family protein [Comamonadaceae bacterium OTU4NAUVB1]|nr:SURF1 family protein [Comamonadaceae bacterium OTU4NAUVB1]